MTHTTETSAQYIANVVSEVVDTFLNHKSMVAMPSNHVVEVADEDNRRVLLVAVPVPEPTANGSGPLTVAELIALLSTAEDLDAPVLMTGRDAGWYQHIENVTMPDENEGIVLPTLWGGADFDTRSV